MSKTELPYSEARELDALTAAAKAYRATQGDTFMPHQALMDACRAYHAKLTEQSFDAPLTSEEQTVLMQCAVSGRESAQVNQDHRLAEIYRSAWMKLAAYKPTQQASGDECTCKECPLHG